MIPTRSEDIAVVTGPGTNNKLLHSVAVEFNNFVRKLSKGIKGSFTPKIDARKNFFQ